MRKMLVHKHNVCVFGVLSCFVCFSNRIWYRVCAYFVYDVLVQRTCARVVQEKNTYFMELEAASICIINRPRNGCGDWRITNRCQFAKRRQQSANQPIIISRAKLKIITFVFIDSIQFCCCERTWICWTHFYLLISLHFCAPILLVSSLCRCNLQPNRNSF